ncbi:quinone oxidoreductase family protein [Microbulbifer hainanensis]|uniref:quinone oxidoreductase family protein n=1 Tax=Microbulbifer hainanensis TaxID=2735675 RepID=UPI001866E94E|nr:zinc-binding alcohol dehydrogenase family protein [Microbulbifer hainanensis]
MKAAVVDSFANAPRYADFAEPSAQADEVIVNVRAAALSQLVRLQAGGKHYTSGEPPFVPGADGVGVLEDGQRVYFAFPRPPVGAMAERVAVKSAYTVALPDDLDDITAAAIANPGMSSWAALTERVAMQPGETVLVNGATGASGRLAIQIAKHLGAAKVIATGRNPATEPELRALGADDFIPLNQPREALTAAFRTAIAAGVDVVLDYLWGPSAEAFLAAATSHGAGEAAPSISFVNIGSLGGTEINLSAGALRSSGVELLGSGLGSVSHTALVRAIGDMLAAVHSTGFQVQAEAVPLADVESAWARESSARLVLTP